MVIKQWPHIMRAKITTESTMDDNGNIIPGTSTMIELECRYRQTPSSREIKTIEGETKIPKGTCLMRVKNDLLKYGDVVSVVGFINDAPIIEVLPHQFRTRITI